MNEKLITLLASLGIIFFVLISIPFNLFSGLSLGVGTSIEIAVAIYIILMSGIFIFIFKKK
ncbi:hypothetical protein [Metallosphaera hakonensis]|uniref:hypothetical protein n=1 Tax=Metallosphaera hakonensis TaxID=79601 RepID=UPI000AAE23F5|nr:hypothetical protein [Metallosphaera hakonensis]